MKTVRIKGEYDYRQTEIQYDKVKMNPRGNLIILLAEQTSSDGEKSYIPCKKDIGIADMVTFGPHDVMKIYNLEDLKTVFEKLKEN